MSGEGYEGENSKREDDKRYGKRKATRRWTQKMRGRIEVTRASSSWRGSERTTLRSLYFCTTPFLFSPLSYPRLVVSHALYLDACRRVLAARACSRARASQKYVILLLYIYIYIYIYALVSMRPPRGIFALWPWCVVPRETLQRPDASKLCSPLRLSTPFNGRFEEFL